MDKLIAGLDIGTSKVVVLIGEMNKDNSLQVIGVGNSPCSGVKKGVVVDIDETAAAIVDAANQAQRMANVEIDSLYVSIAGGHVYVAKNRGIIAVSGENKEIGEDDIKRVLESTKLISLPADVDIIDVLPVQYIVDGYDGIKDPTGMSGVRLEMEADIVLSKNTYIQNLLKSVEHAGFGIEEIIVAPYATASVLLTQDEMELGTVLVDVGGDCTDISVFYKGRMLYSSLLPVGGNHITNDLSVGLKIPYKDAESFKMKYAYSNTLAVQEKDQSINIVEIDTKREIKVSIELFIEIIEARIQEIFALVYNEIDKSGYLQKISAGVVLTGGGLSFIEGIRDTGMQVMGMPVRVAAPDIIGISSPIYSCAVGNVFYSFNRYNRMRTTNDERMGKQDKKREKEGFIAVIKEKFKEFFSDFFD
ncbi:MAG: cell division protein FtsA [Clostridia bacterium]|nr:cell division protein FtsA [Clostridia bacterium]